MVIQLAHRKLQNYTTSCLACDREFYPYTDSSGKYCSRECYHKSRKLVSLTKWEDLHHHTRKAHLIDECNECAMCGIGSVWNSKPLVLQLDHIDGNRSNNTRENLRLLCPNCHTQTDTFAGRVVNKEQPSFYRRKNAKKD